MENPPLKHLSPSDRLYHRIKSRFAQTVDPKHLLLYLSLTIPDEEEVEARQKCEGRQNAAAFLLRRLCRYPDWFDQLLKALRKSDVGLGFLADEFEKCRAEVLVVVEVNQVTDADGQDTNLLLEETMDTDHKSPPGQQKMSSPSLQPMSLPAHAETSMSPLTPSEMKSYHQLYMKNEMSKDTYDSHRVAVINELLKIIFRDLAQRPEEISKMLHHLTQICHVVFSGAQNGCLELLLRVDSLSSLQIFEEYYKGGALQDALKRDLSSAFTKMLNEVAKDYGLKVKSMNIHVSIKAEEFSECALHLRSIQDSTPRRSYLEAYIYPLSTDMSMYCDRLEIQHSWLPVYQNLLRDALLLSDDPIGYMPEIVKSANIVDLVRHVIQFIKKYLNLKAELLRDLQGILHAMAFHQESFVRMVSLEGETRLDVTSKFLPGGKLNTSLEELLGIEILKPLAGNKNAYTFSNALLLEYIASTCSDFFEKRLPVSLDYQHIFYGYRCLNQEDTDIVCFEKFLSKYFPLMQLDLVPLTLSWKEQHSAKSTEFVKYILNIGIIDLSDGPVVRAIQHVKKSLKMLYSVEVKICSAKTGRMISDVVDELIKVSPKQYVRLPAKVSDLSVTEFDAVLKVLSLLDLEPSTRADKGKQTNFQSDQILILKKTGDRATWSPSFHVDFSYLSLGKEKVETLCHYVPCMQHISTYCFNQTNLTRKTAIRLISLMDSAAVKSISLTLCPLGKSSDPLGLSRLPKLEYLDLENTGMEDAGLHSLEIDLEGLHNLKELNVGCNNISLVGLLHLSSILLDKNYLFALRIHGNPFGEAAGPVIGVLLSRMPRLEVLSVWGCDLQDEGMAQLATFFPQRPGLKRLSLRDNNIKGINSVKIFENLAKCHLLYFLDYNNNSLIPAEDGQRENISKAVLKTLTGSESWDYLSFWNCGVSQLAIFDDPTQLKSLHTVTHLCLQTNQINDDIIKKLSAYFQDSKYLQHLNLRENQITDAGAILLASALAGHKHLRELWIDWNMFGYTGADRLIELALGLPCLDNCNLSYSYQLAPPEKHQLLRRVGAVVVHDEVFQATRDKLVVLL